MSSLSKTPLVSVLIPCYNTELYIEEAVRSIMNQTYSNLEIICINDGSIDKTKEILLRLSEEDKRIRYVENESNIKLIATLNKGLKLCKGKYIARMDADDISLPERIEKQVDFLEKNEEYGALGCYIKQFGYTDFLWRMETKDERIRGYLFYGAALPHAAIMLRRSVVFDNNLGYIKEYLHVEDYRLWFDVAKYTKMANLPEVLYLYRMYESQVSTRYKDLQEDNTKKLRREMISAFLEKYNLNMKLSDINISQIKKVNTIKNELNKFEVMYIKIVLYLSLDKYNTMNFFTFIFSGDIFHFPFRKSMRILLKFLFFKHKFPSLV